MIKKYDKLHDEQLSEHFWLREFHCLCTSAVCQNTYVDDDLISKLEELRTACGTIKINDAYRCSKHNNEVGGKPGSYHLLGKAADIKTPLGAALTAMNAENGPFKNGGVGRYGTFIHVDVRGYKARWRM